MGPQLLNCCRPEQVGTKEHGKMLKRIQMLEDAGFQPKRQKTGRLKEKEESH